MLEHICAHRRTHMRAGKNVHIFLIFHYPFLHPMSSPSFRGALTQSQTFFYLSLFASFKPHPLSFWLSGLTVENAASPKPRLWYSKSPEINRLSFSLSLSLSPSNSVCQRTPPYPTHQTSGTTLKKRGLFSHCLESKLFSLYLSVFHSLIVSPVALYLVIWH